MSQTSSLERARNFTRITTENIISVDLSVRLTRRGTREMTTTAGRALARRGSGNTSRTTRSASEDQPSESAGQIPAPQQRRRGSADVSAANILDSPSAPRRTRQGSAAYVSAIRTRSRRQEERHDPMTRKGRSGPKQSGNTTRRKRVRFAVPITRSEAHDLLEQARRMSEEATSNNVPEANGAVHDEASELVEEPTMQHDASAHQEPDLVIAEQDTSMHQEPADPDQADQYALYEEAAAAVEEALDPRFAVIQRLALIAASDPELRALMRIVASRRASRDQLYALQHYINDIDEGDEDIPDSTRPNLDVTAPMTEEDSSPEPELDDKENVPPPQGFGAHASSGSSGSRDYRIDRGGSQPRSALRNLRVITPSPLVPSASRAPRESEASLNNRVRNSAHMANAQRLRREQQNTTPLANRNLERALQTRTTGASPTVTGLGPMADFLPSPTPPRRSGPG
ncbi:MAG: hypothetical protein Q9208_003911 [Pyrenodesmia sp. 3 TL-2023]